MSCPVTAGSLWPGQTGKTAVRPLSPEFECDGIGGGVSGGLAGNGSLLPLYHPDLLRHPEGCPALVLTLIIRRYPLSLSLCRGNGSESAVPRAGRCRRLLPAVIPQPEPGLSAAERDRAQAICPAERISRLHPVSTCSFATASSAILRQPIELTSTMSCRARRAAARRGTMSPCLRALHLRKAAVPAPGAYVHPAPSLPPDQLAVCRSMAAPSPQPPSRELARLSLLGHRAGGLAQRCSHWRR